MIILYFNGEGEALSDASDGQKEELEQGDNKMDYLPDDDDKVGSGR